MTATIEISASINRVFALFLDKDHFPQWKIGYVGREPISGREGEEGAVTLLNYKKFSMIETIEKKGWPTLYIARYDYMQRGRKTMTHRANNQFVPLDEKRTLIKVTSEILEIKGFFMKLMIKMMAKVGEKQFHDQLKLFKEMVEKD